MNPWKVIAIRLLVIGLVLFFAVGCASTRGGAGVEWGSGEAGRHAELRAARGHGPPPQAPAHGYRDKYCYRYYPAREVYFETGRRIYFYLEGGVWKSALTLPYHLQVNLGDHERLELYSDTPFAYHEDKSRKQHWIPPGQARGQVGGLNY